MKRSKRQAVRRTLLLAAFLTFPITIFYFSQHSPFSSGGLQLVDVAAGTALQESDFQ